MKTILPQKASSGRHRTARRSSPQPLAGSVYDGEMRPPRSPAARVTVVSTWLMVGCISDHTVEADVPAPNGIVQPDGSGGTELAAAEACGRIKNARAAAATKLGCDDPGDVCPQYLFVAGSMPCAEFTAGSVDACVAVIESYGSCADLSDRACVVTPVAGSCRKPAAPDGGSRRRDSGTATKDAAGQRDAEKDAEKSAG